MSIFDSKVVVTAGLSGSIRFVNLSSGTCVHLIDEDNSASLPHVNKLAYHDGHLVACGNPWVRMYDLVNLGSPPTIYEGHTGNVTCATIQQDGKWFITTGEDGCVRVWDHRAQGYQVGITHTAPINCGTLHPNQGLFIFGDSEGFINEWDLGANCITRTPSTDLNTGRTGLGVTFVGISDDEHLMFSHSNNHIGVVKREGAENDIPGSMLHPPPQLTFDDASPSHALSPPSPPPLAPLISRGVSLLRLTSPAIATEPDVIQRSTVPDPVCSFGEDVHPRSYITSVHMSDTSGKRISVTVSDGSVSLWNKQDDSNEWSLDCILGISHVHSHSNNWCWDSAFVPGDDFRYVCAAYDDGKCKLWDSSRPSSAPVAVYDAGGTKCLKSLIILDSAIIER